MAIYRDINMVCTWGFFSWREIDGDIVDIDGTKPMGFSSLKMMVLNRRCGQLWVGDFFQISWS